MSLKWFILLFMLQFFSASAGHAFDECRELGLPTYNAKRTVDMFGHVLEAKVFVSPQGEREEAIQDNKVVIRITDAKEVSVFDETSKSGVSFKLPAPPNPQSVKNDPNVRSSRESKDDIQTTVVEIKKGNTWKMVLKIVCRNDGVLLEKVFPVELGGKHGLAVLKQGDVLLGDLNPDLFKVPGHIAIKKK